MLKGCGRAVPALCSVPQRTRKTMGGAHKKKGRLRCHKRPKSREETPKEGSDSGVGLGGRYHIPLAKTIAISGSIERKGSRTDTKVYGARPQGRALPQCVKTGKAQCEHMFSAVHPITDIAKILRHVRFVPTVDIAACPNNVGYYPRRKAH